MTRRNGWVALLPVVVTLGYACGDGSENRAAPGATGGDGGSAGAPPAAGSGGVVTAGSGGAAAGTGAAGGADTGGTAGSATAACGPGECEFVPAEARVVQTSKAGDAMADLGTLSFGAPAGDLPLVVVDPTVLKQEIVGFGASFTESSAVVLQQIPAADRASVLDQTFGPDGAGFTLMRAPIGSSDFGLGPYAYSHQPDLSDFSLAEDEPDLIPLIQESIAASASEIKIVSSPWSAPPFMKDINAYYDTPSLDGGRLLPEHYSTFSDYIVRYIQGYADRGIPIWGITPENEPGGNDGQWESMEFSPQSMADFVAVLGPTLDAADPDVKLLIHDHNRDHVAEWVDAITGDPRAAPYVDGTGVHWYSSTYLVREETLDYVHDTQGPDHLIMNTEGSVGLGSHGPPGDWWNWWFEINLGGPQSWHPNPDDHPMYTPVYRVVRDITVGLNHWFNGWIAWNLALDHEGYPRHAGGSGNTAPFMIDLGTGEIHVTPYFYSIAHFSKYLRPGARVLATTAPEGLLATAAWNPDGTIAVVVANITVSHPDGYVDVIDRQYRLQIGDRVVDVDIPAHSFQTVVVSPG